MTMTSPSDDRTPAALALSIVGMDNAMRRLVAKYEEFQREFGKLLDEVERRDHDYQKLARDYQRASSDCGLLRHSIDKMEHKQIELERQLREALRDRPPKPNDLSA